MIAATMAIEMYMNHFQQETAAVCGVCRSCTVKS